MSTNVKFYTTLEEADRVLGCRNYITLKEAEAILEQKISQYTIKRFKTYFLVKSLFGKKAYFDKAEVENLKKLKGSMVPKYETAVELANEFNCDYRKIYYAINKLGIYVLKKTENLIDADRDYIYKKDIQAIRGYLEDKRDLENVKSIMDTYKINIRRIAVKKGIEGTLNLYYKYILERFEVVKTVKNAKIYSDTYEIIMDTFNKEFEQYSEESIDAFVTFVSNNTGYRRGARYEFVCFVNYAINSLKLKDRKPYDYPKVDKSRSSGEATAYSQEKYLKLFGLLHRGIHNRAYLKEAIVNRAYAQAWLYMYLHYIMIWRTGDILEIPGPNLNHLFSTEFHDGESFLKWLSDESNVFTDEMGIIMCEDVKHKIDTFQIKTNKTNENLIMEIGQLTAPVVGLLFAICEAHRQIISESGDRRFNSQNILTITILTTSNILKTIFDGKAFDILGENFSNRRANKSYNNYIHNYSEESGSCFAAHIISILRGYRDEVSETTTIYETRKADGTIDAIVSRLFDLGSFCFAKLKFIGLSDDSILELDYEEQNKAIKDLDITPFQAEVAIKGIHNQREIITRLIAKMMIQPETVKKIMEQIAFGDSYAKHNHTKCLLKAINNSKADSMVNIDNIPFIDNYKEYWNGSNCMYPESDTCFGCPMLIGEMYFLYELNDAFLDTIKSIETCENDYECYMYSNIIKSYIHILKEAQITLGKNKVNLFVNTQFINEELKRLNGKLILTLPGGKDDNGSETIRK